MRKGKERKKEGIIGKLSVLIISFEGHLKRIRRRETKRKKEKKEGEEEGKLIRKGR